MVGIQTAEITPRQCCHLLPFKEGSVKTEADFCPPAGAGAPACKLQRPPAGDEAPAAPLLHQGPLLHPEVHIHCVIS